MSRRIESPSRTYVVMPFVTGSRAGERKQNDNNSFQSQNANEHVNVPAVNALLLNNSTCNPIGFNSRGPLRKLEPPDAPYPNQEINQLNGYDKTGQRGANIVRIKKNIPQVHPKNYQVYKSNDVCHPIPSTSKSQQGSEAKNAREVTEGRTNHICINVEDSDSSSGSDDTSDSAFFNQRRNINRERLPYTVAEDLEILKFVLEGDNIYRTSSVLLWKELESEKTNPKRTFHSLKNRFLRNIKPLILIKYGKFITPEKAKMLLKKFPELVRRKKSGQTHTCIPIQGHHKKKAKHQWLNKESACLETQRPALPTRCTDTKPGIVTALQGVSAGAEAKLVDLVSSPDSNVGVNCEIKEPAAVPRIELKKKGRLKDVSCQTFEYSAALCSFKEKAAINLNLILIRDTTNSGKMSKRTLLNGTDKPVNVRVTVSLSTGPVKKKLKGSSRRKKIKNRPENVYFLKLRKKTGRNWERKARTYKETAEILFSMIEKRKNVADEGNGDKVRNMVLRSQTRRIEAQEEETGSMTECESSSDDGSYLSEAKRKVESMYKVVILPSSEIDGSQNSGVSDNRGEDAKTSYRECEKLGLLKNMMGQLGQKGRNVKH